VKIKNKEQRRKDSAKKGWQKRGKETATNTHLNGGKKNGGGQRSNRGGMRVGEGRKKPKKSHFLGEHSGNQTTRQEKEVVRCVGPEARNKQAQGAEVSNARFLRNS